MKTRTPSIKTAAIRPARKSTRVELRHAEADTPPEPFTTRLTVPLSALRVSPRNVRRTACDSGIEELAALIDAQGLLQPLVVTRHDADDPADPFNAHYEVEAGGRRLRALVWLRDHGRLAADAPIECCVIEVSRAEEVSLAENSGREDMHPADQFEAFYALAQAGQTIERIAQRFGVTVLTVQRRLRLATVAPELLQLYREGQATLDQLQAISLCSDHERQLAVWKGAAPWQRHAQALRARLTEGEAGLNDPRVRLIGLEAYVAAGGAVRQDLFADAGGQYLTDVALLDRLVEERLTSELDALRAEGWSWVERHAPENEPGRSASGASLRQLQPQTLPLTPEQAQQLETLRTELATVQAELDALYEEDDVLPDQIDALTQQADDLENRIESVQAETRSWTFEQKARAGARLSFANGELRISRGWVPADEKAVAVGTDMAPAPSGRPEFTDSLVRTLTSHRTAALQASLLASTHTALCALGQQLAASVLGAGRSSDSLVQIKLTTCTSTLTENIDGFAQTRAGQRLVEAREHWAQRLPHEPGDWFTWLLDQPTEVVMELLVFCTAVSVDAIRGNPVVPLAAADRLGRALGLDMADWWSATAQGFLQHVSKAQIGAAVTEARGASAELELRPMRKAQAAARAEQLLAGTRWLPAVLRAVAD